jgi:hypothetical protein
LKHKYLPIKWHRKKYTILRFLTKFFLACFIISFFSAPLLTEFDKISLVIPVVIVFICVFSIPLLIVSAILSFTTSDRLKNLESESNLYIFLARRGFTDRESDEIIAELENV